MTVRSAGRYHAAADPEDILRSPGFKDPRVEVFVRIGSSNWAMLAEAPVERRIGAPGTCGPRLRSLSPRARPPPGAPAARAAAARA